MIDRIEYCNTLLEKEKEKEAPTGRRRTPHEVLAWARAGGRTSAGETADAALPDQQNEQENTGSPDDDDDDQRPSQLGSYLPLLAGKQQLLDYYWLISTD